MSFRDPAACLAMAGDRILRPVNRGGQADLEYFLASSAARQLLAEGDIVSTESLSLTEPANAALSTNLFPFQAALLLEHEPIPFQSYPYEWPAEMLHAAATLTIRIARRILPETIGLKDATPFNVLFRGPKPVFVDVLSFEKRDGASPIWLAEAQFVRTFILPLLLYKRYGVPPHQHFVNSREGVPPEDAYAFAGPFTRLSPAFLRWASLPTWLGRANGAAGVNSATIQSKQADLANSQFILRTALRQLDRAVAKLTPRPRSRSSWSRYEGCTHYDERARAAKEDFVARCLDQVGPTSVLDVGCNIGRFSRLAGRKGATVVGIDSDPAVVGQVWRMADAERLNILPLVQSVAMPSPATGWWNRECPSFLDRAAGQFDLVMLLAVVHHLLVTDRIPLDEIVDLAAFLSRRAVLAEYVGPEDEMFRAIARGRDHLHANLNAVLFRESWQRRFRLAASEKIPGTSRELHLFIKS